MAKDSTAGANNTVTVTQTNLSVAFSGVTVSGLSIGFESAIAFDLEGLENGLDNDIYKFSLGGDWGSIRTGDSTAGDNYAVDGTDVLYDRFTLSAAAGVSATLMDDHWLNTSDHNTLTYTSPNFGGSVIGFFMMMVVAHLAQTLLRLVLAIQQQLLALILNLVLV